MKAIAHIRRYDENQWAEPHLLEEHLLKTAELANRFASDFSPEWAELAGRWHDLGKYRKRFQDYIRLKSGFDSENAHIENGSRAPDSTAGAIHAIQQLGPGFGHVLAYLIAGHHAGLPDYFNGKGSLDYRLEDGITEYNQALAENIPDNILTGSCPSMPDFASHPERVSLWIRMLFSCLVDADFLDTESYMDEARTSQRKQNLTLGDLQTRLNEHMASLKNNSKASDLNNIRNNIYQACMAAADWKPGLFSLTVPTGGGKTLSSLAFALEHAKKHSKRRIIYAIPFTSIIEQNAQVFRSFLGDDAVLEHHSNLDIEPEKENLRSRLVAENWDAPLIVTTNVQLFESLHASRTSRCRKLHNLINSVIILDEAQQLPRDFHAPITRTMQQLSDSYGVSWVLCTATQPVLTKSINTFGQTLLEGLSDVREIISEPEKLARDLKRTEIHMPSPEQPKTSWNELVSKTLSHPCVLTIVNTRNQARLITELMGESSESVHLSANMCAEHRSQIIRQVKTRLEARQNGDLRPLRVVSTQLIEAGVDVDFPVVYRAMAGLDSIAQSAGRCNREGKLPELGQVYVFQPEESAPPGYLRQGENTTLELLASGKLDDPLAPKSFQAFFELLNQRGDRDKHGINSLLTARQSSDAPLAIQFREAAQKFRLIDNSGEAVVVPFVPEGQNNSPIHHWLSLLEQDPSLKWIYKKLQRYTITLSQYQIEQYREIGCVEERAGLNVLLDVYYDDRWGINGPDTNLPVDMCVF